MRAVIQRVSRAQVAVDTEVIGRIDAGLLVLLGVTATDTPEQARWLAAVTQATEPVFTRAKRILQEAHVPAHVVETQIVDTVNTQDLIEDILETAQTGHCGTVVVGRESLHGFKALFTSHVGDALIRQAHGLTVWVVE